MGKNRKKFLNRKLYRLTSTHRGTAGYIITKKGIDFLLDKIKHSTLLETIDDLLFRDFLSIEGYKVWQLHPAICIQDSVLHESSETTTFKSTLEDERLKRNAQFINPKIKKNIYYKIFYELVRPLRQIKNKILYYDVPFK